MLVLMRRAGESIHIGDNIVVTLISLERGRARIGIEAPREIAIDRDEIAEKKRLEKLAAEPPVETPPPPKITVKGAKIRRPVEGNR